MPAKTSTRTYRSTLRSEQAASTRRRILAAAASCFIERGYGGTSLAGIAEHAAVSPETVKANGPKRSLLLGAFEQAFGGAESAEPLFESEAAGEMRSLSGDEFLRAAIGFVAGANARTSVLWTELLCAANADPEIAEALTDLLGRRMQDYRMMFEALSERGALRAGLDRDECAAQLSFICSPESHQQLVLQSGWTMIRYEDWLFDTVRRLFG